MGAREKVVEGEEGTRGIEAGEKRFLKRGGLKEWIDFKERE